MYFQQCKGSCGLSYANMFNREYSASSNNFKLIMQSECECCKAKVETEQVTFKCPNGAETKIDVDVIASCSCMMCS